MVKLSSLFWETRRALKLLVLCVPMWTSHAGSAWPWWEEKYLTQARKELQCVLGMCQSVFWPRLCHFKHSWKNFVQTAAQPGQEWNWKNVLSRFYQACTFFSCSFSCGETWTQLNFDIPCQTFCGPAMLGFLSGKSFLHPWDS